MKKALALMAVVLTLGLSLSLDAEAKRLGGGKSGGMQRQAVTAPAQAPGGTSTPSTIPGQATAPAAAGATAAAAPKRSWMGPVAGLAAGLGLAALASHFGFGEALANMLTIALLAMGVMLAIGFVMRKRAQGPAMAGAGGVPPATAAQADQGMFRTPVQPQGGSLIGSRVGSGAVAAAGTAVGQIPAGFDVPGFVRNAKDQFLALQAANDARDVQALSRFLTPEMLEIVRGEIAERGTATQATEVFGLEAQVLEVAEEADRYVVSVRFTGSVREQPGVVPDDLDETWHLTKPRHGAGGWLVAGIQQAA
jgi:predicted lipid-binding transport protein (Tim44 family)